jgi:pyruvate-formate lyase
MLTFFDQRNEKLRNLTLVAKLPVSYLKNGRSIKKQNISKYKLLEHPNKQNRLNKLRNGSQHTWTQLSLIGCWTRGILPACFMS